MAEYMVFIWDDERAWEHASPERVQATMAAHREFIARNASAGRGGSRLHPAAARLTGDLDEAEECAQDAYAQALTAWATSGVPARPGAWLTMVARRRAVDLLRRRDILRAKLPLLVVPGTTAGPGEPGDPRQEAIPDDPLPLGFTR